MQKILAGIEAGGTKFICAVASGPEAILAEARIPTTTPGETLGRAVAFFQDQASRSGPPAALGIASFGPVDLDPQSSTYGSITSTPKPGWAGTDMLAPFQHALAVPAAIETDVNAAAIGEGRWGAAQGLETFLYLTVGTGIGGGALVGGRPLRGMVHPEMGHIRIPHDRAQDPFEGICPYHGDCLEGLATGPAVARRWNADPPSLPDDHPAWALEAHYLALALTTFVCALSPQRIILGGGVMDRAVMFPRIRSEVIDLLQGYVRSPILEAIDSYVVPPGLGRRSGILGALALASTLAGG
jgi:fructokinase